MARIELTGEQLIVHIEGIDRLFTLKSELAVPLTHVGGAASAEPEAREWFKGLRVGTNIPGVLTAGAFYRHGGWIFWDVHDPALAIRIELKDEHFERLIVQVADPQASIAAVMKAIDGRVRA